MNGKPWTKEEIEYLKNWYSTLPTSIVCERLNRTRSSVQNKANQINLKKSPAIKTEDLIHYYIGLDYTARQIAELYHTTPSRISYILFLRGIKKVTPGRGRKVISKEETQKYLWKLEKESLQPSESG